jgi:hypothetical protein
LEKGFKKDKEKLTMRKIYYDDRTRLAAAVPVFEDVDSNPSNCEFAECVVDVLGLGRAVSSLHVME